MPPSPPPSPSTQTRGCGRSPRGRLAPSSSPLTSPSDYGLFPNSNLAANPSPSGSGSKARGGACEGAEVGRNVSTRLGLETEFSLLVATPTMC